MHQEEARRSNEARDRITEELDVSRAEMESLQKAHGETRRIYCTCSAAHGMLRPLKIMPRFLRGAKANAVDNASTSTNATAGQASGSANSQARPASASALRNRQPNSGCLKNSKKQGLGDYDATLDKLRNSSSLPEIGSPQPKQTVSRKGRWNSGRSLRQRLRPDSAPLRRKDRIGRLHQVPKNQQAITFDKLF